MDAFPAFFPLAGRTVAIVGAGEPAEAKARLFEGAPSRLLRLDAAQALDPAAYEGATLAFICAGEADFRAAAATAARAAGAVVNVVDHPALSDFMTPALVDRGAVVAAVSTSGASPILAALLRNDIEARVPPGAGRVAALFGGLREQLRAALPDLDDRRAFLREAMSGPAADAAMAGDMAAARARLEADLAGWSTARGRKGRLHVVMPLAAEDLLSLRAARALAQADVLVEGPGALKATIALARREARRVAVEAATPDTLVGIAGEGLQIVWIGDAPDTVVEALQAAGVAIERLRPAG